MMNRSRRLYSAGPDLDGARPYSRLPVRILLITAVVLALAFILFLRFTGGAIMCVHNWIYWGTVAAVILLLLGAGFFAIHHRVKGEKARRVAAILMIGVMALLSMTVVSFCMTMNEVMLKPVGFSKSPEGENQIVVMRTITDDGDLYTAYPAVNRHFYVAAISSDSVYSNGAIQGVQWDNERLARVLLTDSEGVDRELVVDFAPLYEAEEEQNPEE